MANHRFGLYRSCAMTGPRASSASSDSEGKCADGRVRSCFKGEEIVEHGKITGKWSVVPGSGTDHLSGPRGEGGFEGEFGKGSE